VWWFRGVLNRRARNEALLVRGPEHSCLHHVTPPAYRTVGADSGVMSGRRHAAATAGRHPPRRTRSTRFRLVRAPSFPACG
jgi:hypothetical protein